MPKDAAAPPNRKPPGCCAFRPPRRLEDLTALSELCKALGDSTRLNMVQLLAMAQRPLCVCELESQFDLSQPTISHHLRILREAGVVTTSRQGTWVFYELNPGPFKLFQKLEKLLCVCARTPVVETTKGATESDHE